MQALLFDPTIPRYLAGRTLGRLHRPLLWGRLSALRLREIPDPPLPGDDWVRVAVRLGGICGSDLHLIRMEASPSTSVFASFPFVPGHENVGTIVEKGSAVRGPNLAVGQRVTVEPLLPCVTRGLPPCAFCVAGEYNRCLRFTEGPLGPGLMIGACARTGGSWGGTFAAHWSQVLPLPDAVSDENALLAEPMACALHPLLRTPPARGATILVVGGGVIGQAAIAAIRTLGVAVRVVALVKYPFQAAMAGQMGADEVVVLRGADDYFPPLARLTGGTLLRPMLGRRVLVGGADFTIECVGTPRSVDDALRLTRAGGTVLLLGLAGVAEGVDWTPVWLKELRILGSFAYAAVPGEGGGRRTMEVVLDWMAAGRIDLSALLTHRFPLEAYPWALRAATAKAAAGAFKVAFQPSP